MQPCGRIAPNNGPEQQLRPVRSSFHPRASGAASRSHVPAFPTERVMSPGDVSGGITPTATANSSGSGTKKGSSPVTALQRIAGSSGTRTANGAQLTQRGVRPSNMLFTLGQREREVSIILITDPGPDPDDVKALLVAAILHKHDQILLSGVIANGGGRPEKRAALARCVLDHVGCESVPVGVGSEGKHHEAQSHEYAIAGYESVDYGRLQIGSMLLMKLLRSAGSKQITIVCISSLRDLADAIREQGALVVEKVAAVAVMGGLEWDEATARYKSDTSTNNCFDPEAADAVYRFCFDSGVPLTVVSRNAVTLLPMQLAKSFAERTDCPVMRYLDAAQSLGLVGLWRKLCAGGLPSRCTKEWFFSTFCGVGAEVFAEKGLSRLDESADIRDHLNGFVKPYDVVALMSVLPLTSHLLPKGQVVEVGGVSHRLLLSSDDEVDLWLVMKLLRETYHEVVIATKPVSSRKAVKLRGGLHTTGFDARDGFGSGLPSLLRSRVASVDSSRRPSSENATSGAWQFPGGQGARRAPRLDSKPRNAPMAGENMVAILQHSLHEAAQRQRGAALPIVVASLVLTYVVILALLGEVVYVKEFGAPLTIDSNAFALRVRLSVYTVLSCSFTASMLFAIPPIDLAFTLHRNAARALLAIVICVQSGRAANLFLLMGSVDSSLLLQAGLAGDTVAPFVVPLVFLFHGMKLHWTSSQYLLISAWYTSGSFTVLCGISDVFALSVLSVRRNVDLWVPLVLMGLLHIFLGLCELIPGARVWIQNELSTRLSSGGRFAPLAPIIGFGRSAPNPELLVSCATRYCVGVQLTHEVLSGLDFIPRPDPRLPTSSPMAMSNVSTLSVVPAGGAACCHQMSDTCSKGEAPVAVRCPEQGLPLQVLSRSSAESSEFVPPSAMGTRLMGPRQKGSRKVRRTDTSDVSIDSDESSANIDFYVVHSWLDDSRAKQVALRRWLDAYTDEHGHPPRIWLDAVCTEESLDESMHLEHMPVRLARCCKLLLLIGPTVADRLWCVFELFSWSLIGGRPEDVEVVPVAASDGTGGSTAATLRTIIASIDAFHVMYCEAARDDDKRRLIRAVELASVSRVNDAVRAHLAAVRQACEAADLTTPGREAASTPDSAEVGLGCA